MTMNSSLATNASLTRAPVPDQEPDRGPRITFSSLPPEIREMIWLESFETRTICLHIHQRLTPLQKDKNGQHIRTVQQLVAISFSCTVLPAPDFGSSTSKKVTTPDDAFQQHCNFLSIESGKESGDMGTMAVRTPLGPIQLYVCRESRVLALKRYQRAFAGVSMRSKDRQINYNSDSKSQADAHTWNQRELWEKRIWVDFERDVIFVDTLKRGYCSWSFRALPVDPLVLMRLYAKNEIKKIRRLAVGGRWVMHRGSNVIDQIGPSLMGSQVSGQLQARNHISPGFKYEWLMGLDSLRELLLDDSFGCRKDTRPSTAELPRGC